MRIRIPHAVVRAWEIFGDWVNVPIYRLGRFEVRRIDVIITLGGIACAGYYGMLGGWRGALLGGSLYLLVALAALWIL